MENFTKFPFGQPEGLKPFKVDIPEKELQNLQSFLELSRLPRPTYESSLPDRRLGIDHEWLSKAKAEWQQNFDWRKHESYMNTFPQYICPIIDDDKKVYDIHMVAVFSQNPKAIPVILCHGWPGSFIELLANARSIPKAIHSDPVALPSHSPIATRIFPSSPPPLDKDFGIHDIARLFDRLVTSFGFQAYAAQGGNLGSKVARVIGAEHHACKAVHINFCIMPEPANPMGEISPLEQKGLERAAGFHRLGSAYALEHATKPSTLGFVLDSSPIALLAW